MACSLISRQETAQLGALTVTTAMKKNTHALDSLPLPENRGHRKPSITPNPKSRLEVLGLLRASDLDIFQVLCVVLVGFRGLGFRIQGFRV